MITHLYVLINVLMALLGRVQGKNNQAGLANSGDKLHDFAQALFEINLLGDLFLIRLR